jgi:hypothetical protein
VAFAERRLIAGADIGKTSCLIVSDGFSRDPTFTERPAGVTYAAGMARSSCATFGR